MNSSSDRHRKNNVQGVNPSNILDRHLKLSIHTWTYTNDLATPHIGPMAQDFHAAFGVGPDEKHISTVDADGVALAAIQGLNTKLEQRVKEKDAEISTLKSRLEKLESLFEKLTAPSPR